MTERGARELARRIADYWRARGCKVAVRIEKIEGGRHDAAVWAVRSDLGLFVSPAEAKIQHGLRVNLVTAGVRRAG